MKRQAPGLPAGRGDGFPRVRRQTRRARLPPAPAQHPRRVSGVHTAIMLSAKQKGKCTIPGARRCKPTALCDRSCQGTSRTIGRGHCPGVLCRRYRDLPPRCRWSPLESVGFGGGRVVAGKMCRSASSSVDSRRNGVDNRDVPSKSAAGAGLGACAALPCRPRCQPTPLGHSSRSVSHRTVSEGGGACGRTSVSARIHLMMRVIDSTRCGGDNRAVFSQSPGPLTECSPRPAFLCGCSA